MLTSCAGMSYFKLVLVYDGEVDNIGWMDWNTVRMRHRLKVCTAMKGLYAIDYNQTKVGLQGLSFDPRCMGLYLL